MQDTIWNNIEPIFATYVATVVYHHLKQIDSPVVKQIQYDIYVDNLITSEQTVMEAQKLYNEAKQMFSAASMNL